MKYEIWECRCVFLRNQNAELGRGWNEWTTIRRTTHTRCKYWKLKNIFVTYCFMTYFNLSCGGGGPWNWDPTTNRFTFDFWSSLQIRTPNWIWTTQQSIQYHSRELRLKVLERSRFAHQFRPLERNGGAVTFYGSVRKGTYYLHKSRLIIVRNCTPLYLLQQVSIQPVQESLL